MADLTERLAVSGRGRLLDLACGTGQIAFPLAASFAEVWAVDQEAGSVAYGRARAESEGIANITWVTGSAETVDLDGPFELVAVGNAFQRLDRPLVAERMFAWLQPGGGAALLWGDAPMAGDRPWQGALAELFSEWMTRVAAADRVPGGWEAAMAADPHEQVLARAGLRYGGRFEFSVEQRWTVESLTGFVYSTSFLNHEALGEERAMFERDLAERLVPYEQDGGFEALASYAYELARKPA